MRPFHHVAGGEVPQPPHLPLTLRDFEWHAIRFITYSCSWQAYYPSTGCSIFKPTLSAHSSGIAVKLICTPPRYRSVSTGTQ